MENRTSRALWVALALLFTAYLVPPVEAQIPDSYTNLKVLPKDISQGELMGYMSGFARALGVRCSHCHAGPDNLEGMDFATDELAPKRTAREMMKMVDAINTNYLAKIETGRDQSVEITCKTCHSGLSVPVAIDSLVEQKIESAGLEEGLAHYETLREKHFGSSAYDFSPSPLNLLAERLAGGGQFDAAIALVKLNATHHPDNAYTQLVLAGVQQAAGNLEAAKSALERALEISPENGWAKQRLEAVKAELQKD